MVLINKHRNVGILIGGDLIKTKYISVIKMAAGELTTSSIKRDLFEEEEWVKYEYPVEKAVRRFLEHSTGVSEAARRHLENFIGAQS